MQSYSQNLTIKECRYSQTSRFDTGNQVCFSHKKENYEVYDQAHPMPTTQSLRNAKPSVDLTIVAPTDYSKNSYGADSPTPPGHLSLPPGFQRLVLSGPGHQVTANKDAFPIQIQTLNPPEKIFPEKRQANEPFLQYCSDIRHQQCVKPSIVGNVKLTVGNYHNSRNMTKKSNTCLSVPDHEKVRYIF